MTSASGNPSPSPAAPAREPPTQPAPPPQTARAQLRQLVIDHTPGLVRSARRMLGRGNFVIFHVGRSGSTVLTSLINQHPRIYCDGELFHGYYGAHHRRMEADGANTRFRWNTSSYFPSDPIGFVASRVPYGGLRAFYGFEAKFFHLRFNNLTLPAFLDAVQRLGFRYFVVLERRNSLRKVVSSVVAHGKRQFHVQSGQRVNLSRVVLDVNRVEIDSDSKPLLAYLEDYARNFEALRQLLAGHQMLWLTYEDDVLVNPLQAYNRCCDFFRLERGTPAVNLTRTNPFRLTEMLVNYDEVAAALAGTPFAWMLEDEPQPGAA